MFNSGSQNSEELENHQTGMKVCNERYFHYLIALYLSLGATGWAKKGACSYCELRVVQVNLVVKLNAADGYKSDVNTPEVTIEYANKSDTFYRLVCIFYLSLEEEKEQHPSSNLSHGKTLLQTVGGGQNS